MPVYVTEADDAGVAEVLEVRGRETLLATASAIRLALLLALAALLIYALEARTDIDLRLADALYDRVTGAFPWREAWLTADFNHRIAKTTLTVCAGLLTALALGDAIWPQAAFDRPLARLRLRVIAWSAALVPIVTSLLKQSSNAHCPWDLARYGGKEPYLRLFEALPPGVLPGHCLPAGHASSALWLVSLVVLWLPGPGRKAWRVSSACLAPGLALGWMQQMRGAHFLSHSLWSAWIACAIVLGLVVALQALGLRACRLNGGTARRVPAGTRLRGR